MVDWQGIATVIAAAGAASATVIGALNRRTAQKAHEVGVANNMMLSEQNGDSKPAQAGEIDTSAPPSIPAEASA